MVPLVEENRVLAQYGIEKLNRNPSIGLNAILINAKIHGLVNMRDIGFSIGPRINAAGRISHASKAVDLLTATNEDHAKKILSVSVYNHYKRVQNPSKDIEISKSNKNDVINIIGKPSSISLFDENLWFFIERENVNQSVFKLGKSKIQKNDVIEIVFNDYGIVKTKKIYDLNDMNDLKIIKETTNKSYGSNSPIGKFLKSMEQKLNSPPYF